MTRTHDQGHLPTSIKDFYMIVIGRDSIYLRVVLLSPPVTKGSLITGATWFIGKIVRGRKDEREETKKQSPDVMCAFRPPPQRDGCSRMYSTLYRSFSSCFSPSHHKRRRRGNPGRTKGRKKKRDGDIRVVRSKNGGRGGRREIAFQGLVGSQQEERREARDALVISNGGRPPSPPFLLPLPPSS